MTDFIIPKKSNDVNLKKVANLAGLTSVRIINAINPYSGRIIGTVKDEAIGLSSLGTPIYTDLTLVGMKWKNNLTGQDEECPNDRFRTGNRSAVTNTPQQGGFYMNIETVLMSIDQPINVIKTEIQGRSGTVKEYIGAGDSQITINGIITGRNGVYPKDEVNRLKKWLDAPVAKGIVAWWLDNLGISDIVIESYSIPQVQGGYSYQLFTINAISDAPVELKITQPIV